jgi:hypothetical protein
LDARLTTLVSKRIAVTKPKEVKTRSNLAESLRKSMAQKCCSAKVMMMMMMTSVYHFHVHILPSATQILPKCPLHSAACYKICSVSCPTKAQNIAIT